MDRGARKVRVSGLGLLGPRTTVVAVAAMLRTAILLSVRGADARAVAAAGKPTAFAGPAAMHGRRGRCGGHGADRIARIAQRGAGGFAAPITKLPQNRLVHEKRILLIFGPCGGPLTLADHSGRQVLIPCVESGFTCQMTTR